MPQTNVSQNLTAPQPGNPLADVAGPRSHVTDLRSLGSSGLKEFGGFIYESTLPELTGKRAVEAFKEMGDNDATAGVTLYLINMILRQVPWRVEAASTEPFDVEAADFIESAMDDMDETWADFTSEAFNGMLRYGFALHEQVYKRRAGDTPEPRYRSKYADGRIGWRTLASRSQDSIYRWVFDDNGRLLGAEQLAPPRYNMVYLPLEKCLLFRTQVEKGDPQGRSIFRSAWRSYYLKRGVENIEGVGVERDVCGIPVCWIPQDVMQAAEDKDTDAIAIVAEYKSLATNLRRDAQEGIVMPLSYDASGNKMFDISLLSSAGSRQFDTDKIIARYDRAIARSVLADFLFLGDGAGASGSWAMHSDKTKMFLQSLGTYLDIFCETLNKNAVEPLCKANGFLMSAAPRIEHGSLDQVNVVELADTILKLTQSGMPIFPNSETEAYLRELVGLPTVVDDIADTSDIRPQRGVPQSETIEISDAPAAKPNVAVAHDQVMRGEQDPKAQIAAPNLGATAWPT